LYSQFLFDPNCKNCPKNVKETVSQSALWLSQSDVSSLINKERLSLNFGFSHLGRNNLIPNINSTLKITENLSITSKIYTFTDNKTTPQVLGVGLNYYPDKTSNYNWIFCLQKAGIKGLKDYRQSVVSLSLIKRSRFKTFEILYGLGSNFNKQKLYVVYDEFSENMENQINYFDISILKKLKYLDINFHIISNFNIHIISLMFKKNIF
jgi:hypothetical protein